LLTDPVIAAQRFITAKTASRDVADIITKLRAINRREAAAIAAHHTLA